MTGTAAERVIEPDIAALLAELKRRLERRFGDRFVALYLVGSRARGDHDPDSDVDVAVILDQSMPLPYDAKCELLDDTLCSRAATISNPGPWRGVRSKTRMAILAPESAVR